jgi:hypothetical protein
MRIAVLASALLFVGCGPTPTGYVQPQADPVQVFAVDVDTGETLEGHPGQGYGVFVEYAAGGDWHLWTTCDSDVTGYACRWDLIASVDATSTLEVTDKTELEAPDQVLRIHQGAVRLVFQTDSDTDGVRLAATPGEPLSLDLEWDGPFIPSSTLSWFGGGAVHSGAPSNPVDLMPTTP